ncbi:uncharacterized protein LOC127630549 [Xyrauchen texanus]|uniref:uncharacterized protein LOC127630549 n=1 Tax=Xyrauchen texanus TaxID=154827 RepID=UPI002241E9C0|nr:uncharacterized protein LOC127630549 [Xyrauchen texanus]
METGPIGQHGALAGRVGKAKATPAVYQSLQEAGTEGLATILDEESSWWTTQSFCQKVQSRTYPKDPCIFSPGRYSSSSTAAQASLTRQKLGRQQETPTRLGQFNYSPGSSTTVIERRVIRGFQGKKKEEEELDQAQNGADAINASEQEDRKMPFKTLDLSIVLENELGTFVKTWVSALTFWATLCPSHQLPKEADTFSFFF